MTQQNPFAPVNDNKPEKPGSSNVPELWANFPRDTEATFFNALANKTLPLQHIDIAPAISTVPTKQVQAEAVFAPPVVPMQHGIREQLNFNMYNMLAQQQAPEQMPVMPQQQQHSARGGVSNSIFFDQGTLKELQNQTKDLTQSFTNDVATSVASLVDKDAVARAKDAQLRRANDVRAGMQDIVPTVVSLRKAIKQHAEVKQTEQKMRTKNINWQNFREALMSVANLVTGNIQRNVNTEEQAGESEHFVEKTLQAAKSEREEKMRRALGKDDLKVPEGRKRGPSVGGAVRNTRADVKTGAGSNYAG
jgi:hypothetical protein